MVIFHSYVKLSDPEVSRGKFNVLQCASMTQKGRNDGIEVELVGGGSERAKEQLAMGIRYPYSLSFNQQVSGASEGTVWGAHFPRPRPWSNPRSRCWESPWCVEENVFQNLLRDFKDAKRPDGYQEGDFLPPEATEASLHVGGLRGATDFQRTIGVTR